MSTDWKTAYRVAIREQDPKKQFPLCDRARSAMSERESELGTERPGVRESEQLDRARHRLGVHATKHWMIAALSKEDRRTARRSIDGALYTLQQCEGYLRSYAAGKQNVVKSLSLVYYAQTSLTMVQTDLIKKHKLGKASKS